MNYDYSVSKSYCRQFGLQWLGDDFVKDADAAAYAAGFTQDQVNIAMMHHLWQVRWLFDASHYSFLQRVAIAMHFLFGRSINLSP